VARRPRVSFGDGSQQLALVDVRPGPGLRRRTKYVHVHTPEELAAFERSIANADQIRGIELSPDEKWCPGGCGKLIRRERRSCGRLTCGEFSKLWLSEYARAAGATRRTYRYGVAAFADEFERVRLTDFDRLMARSWALRVPQSNVRVVRAMFNDAINDALHPGPNPFSNLRLEQSRGRKDLTALTEDELNELAEKALDVHGEFGPTFRAMIVFAAYVGLRPGELFALERTDVGRDEVAIRRNLDGTGRIKATKNGRERIVVLPPPARDALADVLVRLDVPWLFVTPRDRRFSKSSLYYYWTPCVRRSDVQAWISTSCATSARHTFSSWVSRMRTSRFSWAIPTEARSSCRRMATRLKT
jgi:integrase